VSYQYGVTIEVWKTQTTASCQDYARELLLTLYAEGMTLVKADYLDLFGNNWGCVATSEMIGSLTVTVCTKSSASSGANVREVTVIRIMPVEIVL